MNNIFLKSVTVIFFLIQVKLSAQWFWKNPLPQGNPLYSVSFYNAQYGFAVGGSGKILKTTDGGTNWIIQYNPNGKDLYSIVSISINTAFAVGDSGTILRTTNGGQDWVIQTSGTGAPLWDVSFIDENNGVVGGFIALFRTTNSGNNWEPVPVPYPELETFSVECLNINTFTCISYYGGTTGVNRVVNGGWISQFYYPFFWWSDISFKDLNNGIFIFEKDVYKTTNGGENWILKTTGSTKRLSSVSYNLTNRAMAVGAEGSIYYSSNGGNNWIRRASPISSDLYCVDLIDANNAYAVGDSGIILKTTNTGISWTMINQIPVELIVFTAIFENQVVNIEWQTATETNNERFQIERKLITNDESTILNSEWTDIGFVRGSGTTTIPKHYSFTDEEVQAGKYQYRLKQIDYDGSFEYSNVIEVEVSLANKFELGQNYPNPFNPVTKIRYTIPALTSFLSQRERMSEGQVRVILKVFDVLGRDVATLVNEEKPAGSYEVEFDAKGLSSGIYFYQLKVYPAEGGAGNFTSTRKMLLLR